MLDIVDDVITCFARAFYKLQQIQIFVNFEIETCRHEKQTIYEKCKTITSYLLESRLHVVSKIRSSGLDFKYVWHVDVT